MIPRSGQRKSFSGKPIAKGTRSRTRLAAEMADRSTTPPGPSHSGLLSRSAGESFIVQFGDQRTQPEDNPVQPPRDASESSENSLERIVSQLRDDLLAHRSSIREEIASTVTQIMNSVQNQIGDLRRSMAAANIGNRADRTTRLTHVSPELHNLGDHEDNPGRFVHNSRENERSSSRTSTTIPVTSYTRVLNEKSRLDKLTFDGNVKRSSPKRFLRKFDKITLLENTSEQAKCLAFVDAMRGAAATWIDRVEFETYMELKHAFLMKYWSARTQRMIRAYLTNGRYDGSEKLSMEEYFFTWAGHAKDLDSPLEEQEIIDCLIFHFHPTIYQQLCAIYPRTINLIAERLSECDIGNGVYGAVKPRGILPSAASAETPKGVKTEKPRTGASSESQPSRYNREHGEDQDRGTPRYFRKRDSPKQGEREGRTRKEGNSQPDTRSRKDANVKSTRDKRVHTMETPEESREAETDSGGSATEEEDERKPSTSRHSDEENRGEVAFFGPNEEDFMSSDEESQVEPAPLQKSPTITVRIGKIRTEALVDTGAQISVISSSLVEEIARSGTVLPNIPIKKLRVRGLFNDRLQVVRTKVLLEFNCGECTYSQPCLVVNDVNSRLILGIDFLIEHRAKIDTERGIITLFRKDKNNDSTLQPAKGNKPSKTVITIKANPHKGIGSERKKEIKKLLDSFADLFRDEIGCIKDYVHEIKVTKTDPYCKPIYPIPNKHIEDVQHELNKWVQQGIVARSPTSYVNPLVVVIKPTGKIRLCLDARELNDRMEPDHARPPTIDHIFAMIGKTRYFTNLDINNAFLHVPLKRESRKYTGFLFQGQTYVFKRLPFGLKTSGAAFTRALGQVLGPELERRVIFYLDDILIATDTWEEHIEILTKTLNALEKAGVRVNRDKSHYAEDTVKFLGHFFLQDRARISEETKTNIQRFAVPRTRKALQSFLGLVNWDRRFVPRLSTVVRPLERLLAKESKFEWTEKEQRAFDEAKDLFRKAECLFYIDPELDFILETDASTTGTGARLLQIGKDGTERTIAYTSKSLSGAETRYTTTELEALAVVRALKKWRTILVGYPITVRTDHKALKFLSKCVTTSNRIARWVQLFQHFDITWTYLPGKCNTIADSLSRLPIKEQTLKTAIIAVNTNEISYRDDLDWTEEIALLKAAQSRDHDLCNRKDREPESVLTIGDIAWVKTPQGYKLFIPDAIADKWIAKAHSYLAHYGTDKVVAFLRNFCLIANLERLARDIVAACEICQYSKYYTRASTGEQYYELPEGPGEKISVDLYGPLPTAKHGYRYVLVTLDHFSKLTQLYPMQKQTVDNIVSSLERKYFTEWGKPKTILSDRGGQFLSTVWKNFGIRHKIELIKTTPYNPQSNPVERVMRELGRLIRVYSHHRPTRWQLILPRAMSVMNGTVHSSTLCTPWQLHRVGEPPLRTPMEFDIPESADTNMESCKEKAKQQLKAAAEKRYKQFIKRNKPVHYKVGDRVLRRTHKLSSARDQINRKICLLYEGPFEVANIPKRNAYELIDNAGNNVGTYNARQLRPFRQRKLGTTSAIVNHLMIESGDVTKTVKRQAKTEMFNDMGDLVISMQIGNEHYPAVVDTGAQISILDAQLARRVKKLDSTTVYTSVRTLKKEELIPIRSVDTIKFGIEQTAYIWDFHVADIGNDTIILGSDWMTHVNAKINLRTFEMDLDQSGKRYMGSQPIRAKHALRTIDAAGSPKMGTTVGTKPIEAARCEPIRAPRRRTRLIWAAVRSNMANAKVAREEEANEESFDQLILSLEELVGDTKEVPPNNAAGMKFNTSVRIVRIKTKTIKGAETRDHHDVRPCCVRMSARANEPANEASGSQPTSEGRPCCVRLTKMSDADIQAEMQERRYPVRKRTPRTIPDAYVGDLAGIPLADQPRSARNDLSPRTRRRYMRYLEELDKGNTVKRWTPKKRVKARQKRAKTFRQRWERDDTSDSDEESET